MSEKVKLTQLVKCAGCAGKLKPSLLDTALSGVQWPDNEHVIHKMGGHEDCGVYRLDDTNALVHTTDFFTPVVDDPYIFGQIAAANALSDIYAMGGTALSALNIVCYPEDLGPKILHEILAGGASKAKEADCPILGGHSVNAPELKYGLAVTGKAPINKIFYNRGAKPGDVLILTKPLGTGILNTAVKRGKLGPGVYEELVGSMTRLNRYAGEILHEFPVHAVTDITGFSLIGHAMEMSRSSGVDLEVDCSKLPLLPGLTEAIEAGHVTRGDVSNREYAHGYFELAPSVSQMAAKILFDPQTSGGLLIAVDESGVSQLLKRLDEHYPHCSIIGFCKEAKGNEKVGRIFIS